MGGEASLAYQIANGLIGTAGNYMAAREPAPDFMADRSTFDAGLSTYQQNIDLEYEAANKQADLLFQEFELEAKRQAEISEYSQQSTAQAFNASGVRLDGSPLAIMARERNLKQQEIEALKNRTTALADLYRTRATIGANEGRMRIAGLQADYITKAAQAKSAYTASSFGLRQSALFDTTNLLGASLGLVNGTGLGGKFFGRFKGSGRTQNKYGVGTPFTAPTFNLQDSF